MSDQDASTSQARGKRKHDLDYWFYFKKNQDKIECNYCGWSWAPSTSIYRLRQHYSKNGKLGIRFCPRAPPIVVQMATEDVQAKWNAATTSNNEIGVENPQIDQREFDACLRELTNIAEGVDDDVPSTQPSSSNDMVRVENQQIYPEWRENFIDRDGGQPIVVQMATEDVQAKWNAATTSNNEIGVENPQIDQREFDACLHELTNIAEGVDDDVPSTQPSSSNDMVRVENQQIYPEWRENFIDRDGGQNELIDSGIVHEEHPNKLVEECLNRDLFPNVLNRELIQQSTSQSTAERRLLDDRETRKRELFLRKPVGQAFQASANIIWSYLLDECVSRIGIYGMVGVGKTELVRHVQNEILKGFSSTSFDHVHRIPIPKKFSIDKLQNAIARALDLHLSEGDDEYERRDDLSNALRRAKNTLFILDDMWHDIDFDKIGIPMRVCKWILVTRSFDVCRRIGCEQIIKMKLLSDKDGEELFIQTLGEEKLSADLQPIANTLIRECSGLPLGIISMAKNLRPATRSFEWRDALDSFITESTSSKEMIEVFDRLKESYDCLSDESLKESFLYCALFPKDFSISSKDLIEYLIVEGIINKKNTRRAQHDNGNSMLQMLVNSNLLETDPEEGNYEHVKMHRLVRKMAIQILRNECEGMVKAGESLEELPAVEEWSQNLKRVSFFKNDVKEILSGYKPYSPNLSTLLLCRNHKLELITDSFFKHMHRLKVLDLSHTNIRELPSAISDLLGLEALLLSGCEKLRLIPSLGKIKKLKKLDLSKTGLREVPHGMNSLSNLTYLDLHGISVELPHGIFSYMSSLQILKLSPQLITEEHNLANIKKLEYLECHFSLSSYLNFLKRNDKCAYDIVIRKEDAVVDEVLWERANKMKNVCDVRRVGFYACDIDRSILKTNMKELAIVKCQLNDQWNCLFPTGNLLSLQLRDCDGIKCFENPFTLLEILQLQSLRDLSTCLSCDTFTHLKIFAISDCPRMKTLFSFDILRSLESLEELVVKNCEIMEEIIAKSEEVDSVVELMKLRNLDLQCLPELKSICSQQVICPSLQEITLRDCQNLRRIPFSHIPESVSVHPKEWWELVERQILAQGSSFKV